jgi:hypothetical protein
MAIKRFLSILTTVETAKNSGNATAKLVKSGGTLYIFLGCINLFSDIVFKKNCKLNFVLKRKKFQNKNLTLNKLSNRSVTADRPRRHHELLFNRIYCNNTKKNGKFRA